MIKKTIRTFISPIIWRWINYKNDTNVEEYSTSFRINIGKNVIIRKGSEVSYRVQIGDYSYISGPGSYVEDAIIGKYCSIARQCTIGVSGHNYNWITTHPFIISKNYGFLDHTIEVPQKPAPIIGHDVWIGINSIIMRGVKIGNGAVVAANSVVTKDVEPYSIVGGNPAKHIKYRFSEEEIKIIEDSQWWNWSMEKLKLNIDMFYKINEFINFVK